MPTEAELPPRIASLARRNALELTGRRWRYDVEQILGLVNGGGATRAVRRMPTWAKVAAPLAVIAAVVAGIAVATGGGKDTTVTASKSTPAQRPILAPATVPPAVDVCQEQLLHGADGTVGPVACKNGDLNQLAWETYSPANPVLFGLGPNATPTQAQNAMCVDLLDPNVAGTNPRATVIYQLAELYYGWQFGIVPSVENC
jgi:hypothetical protein